jgi:hypothetical protein
MQQPPIEKRLRNPSGHQLGAQEIAGGTFFKSLLHIPVLLLSRPSERVTMIYSSHEGEHKLLSTLNPFCPFPKDDNDDDDVERRMEKSSSSSSSSSRLNYNLYEAHIYHFPFEQKPLLLIDKTKLYPTFGSPCVASLCPPISKN